MSEPFVLHYLAIGRLLRDSKTNDFAADKHKIIASNLPKADDEATNNNGINVPIKQIRNHLKAIMKRGAHKLLPGKRIRLKSDDSLYDVHILTDCIEEDEQNILVFFAITVPNFNKYYNLGSLLRDFKSFTYDTIPVSQLKAASNSCNSTAQPLFNKLMSSYAHSQLVNVQIKVDEIKDLMQSSVDRALNNVEQLENMEEKADLFENQSKLFEKKAVKMKQKQRSNYYKLTILAVIVVLGILAYILVPLV
jgi:hypothetical protein